MAIKPRRFSAIRSFYGLSRRAYCSVLMPRFHAPSLIMDGEIIAIRRGRPDFGLLQSRMHRRHPPGLLVRQAPVQLYLFDLLYHDGQ